MSARARSLPGWAVEPLDAAGLARALGVSRTTLRGILERHPHFELRGRKRVFYPEHVQRIRDGLEAERRAVPAGRPRAPRVKSDFDQVVAELRRAGG